MVPPPNSMFIEFYPECEMAANDRDNRLKQSEERYKREKTGIENRFDAQITSLQNRKQIELDRLEERYKLERQRLETGAKVAKQATPSTATKH